MIDTSDKISVRANPLWDVTFKDSPRTIEQFAIEMAGLEFDHRKKLARIAFWYRFGIRLIILGTVLAIFAPVIGLVFHLCLKSVAPIV